MLHYSKGILAVLAVSISMIGSNAHAADEDTGFRKIINIGCSNVNDTCFVVLDGPLFGASLGCPSGSTNEFRFNNGDTTYGKRTYASLLAAYLAGKRVSAYLSGCTAEGAPALKWFHITD